MKAKSKTFKWTMITIIGLWWFISFVFLAGEESPERSLSITEFLIIKAAALASLLICTKVGGILDKKGWLPDMEDDL